MRGANGMMDLKRWECGVPGKEKTIWEGGLFRLEVTFPDEYPTKPPKCTFTIAHEQALFPHFLPQLFQYR
jgi:ubiquitin-conjugating enzyme E2 I